MNACLTINSSTHNNFFNRQMIRLEIEISLPKNQFLLSKKAKKDFRSKDPATILSNFLKEKTFISCRIQKFIIGISTLKKLCVNYDIPNILTEIERRKRGVKSWRRLSFFISRSTLLIIDFRYKAEWKLEKGRKKRGIS
jgi:hypothetical protein